ncbi:hypothetical protein OIU77_026261 [Salix suchowensis]|uniref:3-beta hydroxysteroid dehydrogenase/isomerase domain-containing protein n=1 Tax=Salix suchowensis TaxID=1278906 RepID=A0ABQ9C230_9ROSI|nr:hypothetical protein OIU77_026261 [Salix suchowensis]
MLFSQNEGIEDKTFVVTGGLGFVGSHLCLDLVRRGARQVRAFDLRPTSPWSVDLKNHGGDVARKKDVDKALHGADCVFHLASHGMSGKEMVQFGRVDEEIVNGNESLPFFPVDDHVDPYGRSKSIAEWLVLKHNARPFKKNNGKCLFTCAIRPAAIYGPGEERHFPRIVSLAKLGLLPFKIGDSDVKTDWVYVDNLVLALILASMGLLDDVPSNERHPVAAGQPYFISDGSPINTFEFLQPLLKSLDYDLPKASLSVPRALLLGRIFWAIYTVLHPWLNRWWFPQPLILPAEVYKVGVTHYFSFLKAKQELGYVPVVSPREGMAATISYWQERKRKTLDGPTIYASAAYLPVDIAPVPLLRATSLFIFRSMRVVRTIFLLAMAAHIGEAVYAWHLAKRVDTENARAWFWQTLVFGIRSLRFLMKRSKS